MHLRELLSSPEPRSLDAFPASRPRKLLLILLVAALASCKSDSRSAVAGRAPWDRLAPRPIDTASAGLGLSLVIDDGGIFPTKTVPEVVLFVRLEDGEGAQDLAEERPRQLIQSTLVAHRTAYLLNASPGRYVAVAGLLRRDTGETRAHWKGGGHLEGIDIQVDDGKSVDCYFFPREMITASLTTLEPGSLGFMGSFAAEGHPSFDNADELQARFESLVRGMDRSALEASYFHDQESRRLTLSTARTDPEAQAEFCKAAKRDLVGTAWIPRISTSSPKP